MKATISRALFALIFSLCAIASATAGDVKVANAWARATVPGQKTAAIYMDIVSDDSAEVVGAASPIAARAELHSMRMDGGVMRMRPLSRVELPKGMPVKLTPNGTHLMLFDLKRPLKAGERIAGALTVQTAARGKFKVDFEADVRGLTGGHEHSH